VARGGAGVGGVGCVVRLASDQAGSEHWDEYGAGMLGAVLDAVN
jgi:hypothetical protein